MQCCRCRINYPQHLVVKLQICDGFHCGVCALEKLRQFRGDPTLVFTGARTKKLYNECVSWRQNFKRKTAPSRNPSFRKSHGN
jgi:hypothetical protein